MCVCGLLPSQTEPVFSLGRFIPSGTPYPWPSSRGRWQWMLRSQTKHAGLLFGGGRLSAPLAPCQKHVQPLVFCLREVLFSLPSPIPFSPLKHFLSPFCTEPAVRQGGNEGAGRFSQLGVGEAVPSATPIAGTCRRLAALCSRQRGSGGRRGGSV